MDWGHSFHSFFICSMFLFSALISLSPDSRSEERSHPKMSALTTGMGWFVIKALGGWCSSGKVWTSLGSEREMGGSKEPLHNYLIMRDEVYSPLFMPNILSALVHQMPAGSGEKITDFAQLPQSPWCFLDVIFSVQIILCSAQNPETV